jgi:glycosyltransferase involved in cell wall biosynthesis
MKVAFFTENSYSGGLDVFLVNMINNWPAENDRLFLVCNRSHPGLKHVETRLHRSCEIIRHDIPMFWALLARLRALPFGGFLAKAATVTLRHAHLLLTIGRCRGLIEKLAPDRLLVVNGGYPGGDSCRAAAFAWKSVAQARNLPLSIHNVHNLANPARIWERMAENIVDRRLSDVTNQFAVVSEATARALRKRLPDESAAKIHVILNGVADPAPPDPHAAAALREELGIGPENPLCLMLGTYEPRKGHAFLFAAFRHVASQLPDARLLICGFGYPDDIARVKRIAQDVGVLDNTVFCDVRDDVDALYAAADVLAVPSQTFESFGLTVAEAMARGVPVVTTDIGGLPEVVGDGGLSADGGVSLSATDVEGFADALTRVLKDRESAQAIGLAGMARYRERFRSTRMAADYATAIRADGKQTNCL